MSDGPTLVEVLEENEAPQTGASGTQPIGPADARRVVLLHDQGADFVRGKLEPVIGRALCNGLTWLHFTRADGSAGALVTLDNFASPGEFELSIIANRGLIGRSVLRCIARWAFMELGARRLVVRLRPGYPDLADLARRAGFRLEVTARGFYEDGGSAHVWSMLREECPWLPRRQLAIPVIDISPPSSIARH